MSDHGISLKAVLLGETPSAAITACVGAATAALRTGLAGIPKLDWASVAAGLAGKVEAMLDIGLSDVLAGAWRDYVELRDCADPAKHAADEAISLPMADHSIEATFAPYLEVAIGARPPLRVAFEIKLGLELQGVILRIEDATIRSLRLASCRGGGTVSCEGVPVFERKTRELEFPGEIMLAGGIPIDRLLGSSAVGREDQPAPQPQETPADPAAEADAIRLVRA
jgi:hypothetical protein